uniref:Uncharacterized protein n=1 Tax=Oryza barthii TaxID=65489 RepID=A0A0D3FIR0_9ORYZ
MSGSSVLATEVLAVNGGSSPLAAAAVVTTGPLLQGFAPSVWGDFFITYAPSNSQACRLNSTVHRSEQCRRERAEALKGQVRRKLVKATSRISSVAEMVVLVDTLERLGIDNHFRHEIAAMLHRVHSEEHGGGGGAAGSHVADDDLHFRDNGGSFRASLSSDARGLLSLYNAAHLAMPGEEVLDDAIAFSRRHLRSMKTAGKLRSPMAEQVSRALDIPLPRTPRRLEAMRYIHEYGDEPGFDGVVLELARLDFELVKSLHLRELKALSLWWKDFYDNVKLSYTRDRIVEVFFWVSGVYYEEEYSRARIMLAKVFGLITLMDDTYDVQATLDECCRFNEAIQRWDNGAVSLLPEYMHAYYIKLLSNFDEMENSLEPNEKHRVSYAITMYKQLSEYYLQEARWSSHRYLPSFAEHLYVSSISSGIPALAPAVLMGVHDGDSVATKEALEWACAIPDLLLASGEVGRLLNDIAAWKVGKNRKDVQSLVETYMTEHGAGGDAAVAAVAAASERAWRRINRACVEAVEPALLPAAQLLVNLTSTMEVVYLGGKDGYTSGSGLKGERYYMSAGNISQWEIRQVA